LYAPCALEHPWRILGKFLCEEEGAFLDDLFIALGGEFLPNQVLEGLRSGICGVGGEKMTSGRRQAVFWWEGEDGREGRCDGLSESGCLGR